MNHIVALSGGKDSTAMALRLMEVEPRDYQFCITPTGRELPAMEDHWKRLECLLGKPIIRIPGPKLDELIIKQLTVPNHRMRFCTRMVKIEPFQRYAASVAPATCYVGIRADESEARAGTNHTGIKGVVQDCPLDRWGWEYSDVQDYLRKRAILIPARTDCDYCYHQQIAEWWNLWHDNLPRFIEAEWLEYLTGHTFRSEQRDSWPASLHLLRKKFEAGFRPKKAGQQLLTLDNLAESRSTMCAWCAR